MAAACTSHTMTPFVPAWWLPGPHLQTLGARFTRSSRGIRFRRERVELPDGDFLDLDWPVVLPLPRTAPLVVVLHGLEGSARSGYATEAYRQLAARGLAAVGINFRSCSGALNRAPRMYHSGETGDLRYASRLLRVRYPRRPLGALGFSIGGNVLLKYLGEEGAKGTAGVFDAAVAVSVPFDLNASADHLERGFARVYVWRLLRSLRRKVRAKGDLIRSSIDYERALAASTFREFDDAATARLHGFSDADDYYRQSSSARFLPAVRVPTLLIHADDDPFLPAAAVPRNTVRGNPYLRAAFTPKGGHVGFVAGAPWGRRYWAEATAADALCTRLAGSD